MPRHNYIKIIRALSVLLTIALAFTIASGYELYKLVGRFNSLQSAYATLENQKRRVVHVPVPLPPSHKAAGYTPITPQQPAPATLAQKNKNPLNIKRLGHGRKWEGQIGVDKFGHVIFSSWEHGVRAASFTLRSYARRHKVDTIDALVSRFCTAKGKNYEKYVRFLCKRIGVQRKQKIDLVEHMPQLLRAMARFESGMNLPEELFVPYDVVAYL